MSRILNRSIQDNKNILKYLKIQIETNTIKVLVSQSEQEINEIENDLLMMNDELKYINSFNKNTLKNEIEFIQKCIDLALVSVSIARNQPFTNN